MAELEGYNNVQYTHANNLMNHKLSRLKLSHNIPQISNEFKKRGKFFHLCHNLPYSTG